MMKLKVCGMRGDHNIEDLVVLNPNYIGFIFYEKSPRYAPPFLNRILLNEIPHSIKKTGVFVNADENFIFDAIQTYALDTLQLHGDETPEVCQQLKVSTKKEIIKAFRINNENDILKCESYANAVDYFLFDTKTKGYGGSGMKFDWKLLEKYYKQDIPFFISGGVEINDIPEIKKMASKLPIYAIDVNSKFEIEPGLKDIDKIRQFKLKLED